MRTRITSREKLEKKDFDEFIKLYKHQDSKSTREKTLFMYNLLSKNDFSLESTMAYIGKIVMIEVAKNDIFFVINVLESKCKIHFDKNILQIQKEGDTGISKVNFSFVSGYTYTLKDYFSIKEDNFDISGMSLLNFFTNKMKEVMDVEVKRIEDMLRTQIIRLIEYNSQKIDIKKIVQLEELLYGDEENLYDDSYDDDYDDRKKRKPRM